MSNKCQRCESHRIAYVNGKTSDQSTIRLDGRERDGYIDYDLGIGGGDYIDFDYCLECGQMQGEFPLPLTSIERDDDEDD